MLDYVIHRLTYTEAKERYPDVEFKEGYMPTDVYLGFWEGAYVGYMAGSFENINTINIQYMQLMPEFLGKKVVRIIREIIKKIHKDFKYITMNADNTKNNMIRILLSAGFKIIGTKADEDITVVILLKTANG